MHTASGNPAHGSSGGDRAHAAPTDASQPHSGNQPTPQPAPGRLNLLLSDASYRLDSWASRLPTLLSPMGIQAHHAGSGSEASQLIENLTIHVAVVDLGLPLECAPPDKAKEGGYRLLDILARLAHRPPTVAITSAQTHRDEVRQLNAALKHGAFAVINRPRTPRDVETLLEVLRRCVIRHYKGQWPTG